MFDKRFLSEVDVENFSLAAPKANVGDPILDLFTRRQSPNNAVFATANVRH